MTMIGIILVVALILYLIVACHPRRFGLSSDLTAIGLALIAFTILFVTGSF